MRAFVFNFTTQGYLNFAYRMFAYADIGNPDVVSSPLSPEFLVSAGFLTLISSGLSAGTDVSIRSMRKKGHISQRTENFIFAVLNLLTQMNGAFLSLQWNVPLFFGVCAEYGAKLGVIALDKMLSTKGNRFVLIHPAVSESAAANVKYLFDLEEALKVKDMTSEEFHSLAAQLDLGKAREEKYQYLKAGLKRNLAYFRSKIAQSLKLSCRGLKLVVEMGWW